jgi:hypothetical protein
MDIKHIPMGDSSFNCTLSTLFLLIQTFNYQNIRCIMVNQDCDVVEHNTYNPDSTCR